MLRRPASRLFCSILIIRTFGICSDSEISDQLFDFAAVAPRLQCIVIACNCRAQVCADKQCVHCTTGHWSLQPANLLHRHKLFSQSQPCYTCNEVGVHLKGTTMFADMVDFGFLTCLRQSSTDSNNLQCLTRQLQQDYTGC